MATNGVLGAARLTSSAPASSAGASSRLPCRTARMPSCGAGAGREPVTSPIGQVARLAQGAAWHRRSGPAPSPPSRRWNPAMAVKTGSSWPRNSSSEMVSLPAASRPGRPGTATAHAMASREAALWKGRGSPSSSGARYWRAVSAAESSPVSTGGHGGRPHQLGPGLRVQRARRGQQLLDPGPGLYARGPAATRTATGPGTGAGSGPGPGPGTSPPPRPGSPASASSRSSHSRPALRNGRSACSTRGPG